MVRDSRMVRDGCIIDVAPEVWSSRGRMSRPPAHRAGGIWRAATSFWRPRVAMESDSGPEIDDVEWVWAFLRHDSSDSRFI